MTRIQEFGAKTLDAIVRLEQAEFYMQGLVVLYSAIDTLAWATKKDGDVTKDDFCSWVATYMRPERLGCTPEDLYAARCALVHSGGVASRMSRTGAATELWYATAGRSVAAMQAVIDRRGWNVKVVSTTDLLGAFGEGVLLFSNHLDGDIEAQQQVAARIDGWLGFFPARSVVQAWEAETTERAVEQRVGADGRRQA